MPRLSLTKLGRHLFTAAKFGLRQFCELAAFYHLPGNLLSLLKTLPSPI